MAEKDAKDKPFTKAQAIIMEVNIHKHRYHRMLSYINGFADFYNSKLAAEDSACKLDFAKHHTKTSLNADKTMSLMTTLSNQLAVNAMYEKTKETECKTPASDECAEAKANVERGSSQTTWALFPLCYNMWTAEEAHGDKEKCCQAIKAPFAEYSL